MINVDIIIPSIISYQKYPQFQKFQKFQGFRLFQKLSLPSWMGNWFPVWYNLKNLKKRGIRIRFLNYLKIKHRKFSNIVGFDSRIINNLIFKHKSIKKTISDEIIPLLKKLKLKVDYLVFFDNADSTGHFHYHVLPYVDLYLKKQLLKDFSLYAKSLCRKRLFTDFYARNYNFPERNENRPIFTLESKHLNKISLSWNFALKDYRSENNLSKFLNGFIRNKKLRFSEPNLNRRYILAANYTVKKSYELVYFQRNQLLKILSEKYKSNPMVSIGKIPKKIYLKTMRSSKAIISPFGWGEICYRDFETFISGAALIKPDMNHLNTWPNIFKENRTYIPIPWRIEEWSKLIPEILSDEKNLIEIAKNGQRAYNKIWAKKGSEAFCDHFVDLITPK